MTIVAKPKDKQLITVAVDLVFPNPEQPREHFDDKKIDELAQSIATRGMEQLPLAEALPDGSFILVDGERRLKAVKRLGWKEIDLVVIAFRGKADEARLDRLLDAYVANEARASLNPIEKARTYKRLKVEFRWTLTKIAKDFGVSVATISIYLQLLKYEAEIQTMIMQGLFPASHAVYMAMRCIGDPKARVALASRYAAKMKRGERVTNQGIVVAAKRLVVRLQEEKIQDLQNTKQRQRERAAIAEMIHSLPAEAIAKTMSENGLPKEDEAVSTEVLRQAVDDVCKKCEAVPAMESPAWRVLLQAANKGCDYCALSNDRSLEFCKNCPAPQLLIAVTKMVKEHG